MLKRFWNRPELNLITVPLTILFACLTIGLSGWFLAPFSFSLAGYIWNGH